MLFAVLFTNLPAACGVLPGLSVVAFDERATNKALLFCEEKFGVRPNGRFGQRVGKNLWNLWSFRLHDHWRANTEEFFFESFSGFENGTVSTEVHSGLKAASVCAHVSEELKTLFSLQKMERVHALRAVTLQNCLGQAHEHPLALPCIRVGRAPSMDTS